MCIRDSYNGVLVASAKLNLTGEGLPYHAGYKLRNIDISAILKDTPLGAKGIKGILFSEIEIEGRAKDINSVSGNGNIIIKNANLGPMPLLTPLFGHVYGYLQHVFPELKKVSIQDASCDFTIENRKIMSNNIVLEGESVGIYGKGYMDFDTNLNFEVENQIAGPEQGAGEDWQTNLQQMIVQVGKIASKAYLTGTLTKPKWKFQYLGGMQNILRGGLKGGLGEKLKGIFER